MSKKEKQIFMYANVFADDEDNTLVDEGYFTGEGFYSTLVQKMCACTNRLRHEAHLQEIIHNIGTEDAE